MNSIDITAATLVDWVDFKWLMVGDGRAVDLDRLQHDPAYAAHCVDLALVSPQQALRRLAQKLRRRLLPAV